MKAGLQVLRTAPAVGAVIGASSNVATIYAIGYAACRFYEAQLAQASAAKQVQASVAASDRFLEQAIAQEAVMDCIILRVLRAGHPEQSWEELALALADANLAPGSQAAMARYFDQLPPLEELLPQVSTEFAAPLLQQCRKVAALDGRIDAAEAEAIAAIAAHFDLDPEQLDAEFLDGPEGSGS